MLPLIIGGYLLGSIPTAQLAARLLKGIDLRQYGSGTISATGLYYHVAPWAIVPVGLFDVFKGALPAWVGLQLDPGLAGAVAGGLAAVVGHNWSAYLGLRGGRGIGPFMGVLSAVYPWGVLWVLASLALGRLMKATGLVTLIGLSTLVLLSWLTGQALAVNLTCLGMVAFTLLKRLEANRTPLPADWRAQQRVLLRRLLMDRDAGHKEMWTERRPNVDGQ